ncbi:hypothetical protein VP01_23g9 [Puccinia sorghi]|uniref:Uncharacterized protein n=1 Tax=Puccinia sorghi TaxID=27349 RepID=A0A0L6V6P2_9BASI|nr:hypothetical protein VP01_23g9 [Puccinia sorghi]
MALGSIAHLQHYFVRNGLAANNRSASHKNMILAIPGRDPDQFSEEDQLALQNLPPEPAPPPPKPSQPQFPAGRALPNLTDLESARQEVMAQLDQVCESWGLIQLAATRAPSVASNRSGDDELNQSLPPSSSESGLQNLQLSHFSSSPAGNHNEGFVIDLISLTTRAVRSVQKFILTIPDPDIFSPANISNLGGDLQRRMSQLELSTAARPRTSRSTFIGPPSSSSSSSSSARPDSSTFISRRATAGFDPFALFKKRTVAGPMRAYANSQTQPVKDDPLLILRKMSLEVLACLKDIEHKFRIPGSSTPMDNSELSPTWQSPNQNHKPDSPPSMIESKIAEQDDENSESSLILPNMSWEYRHDVSLEEVREEALVVKEWLECVDGILEGLKIITGRRRKKVNLTVLNHPKAKKKKSTATTGRNVFRKIMNSSKLQPNHSPNPEIKVPDISLDDATTEDDSNSEPEEEQDSEELLPDWARNDRFIIKTTKSDENGNQIEVQESDQFGRLFSCLSQRPWGFIPVESINNLAIPAGMNFQSILMSPTAATMSRLTSEQSTSKAILHATDEQGLADAHDRLRSPISAATIRSRFPNASPPSSASPISSSAFAFPTESIASSSVTATANNSPSAGKVGLTFRRLENIKFWAAALKLRYMIKGEIPLNSKTEPNLSQSTPPTTFPLDPTSTSSTTTVNHHHPHQLVSSIKFDPKVIAKKSDGWDIALAFMVFKWLDSIQAEKREEVLFSK